MGVSLVDEIGECAVPSPEVVERLFLGALLCPAFAAPVMAFDNADEVGERAASQSVGDSVAAGPCPDAGSWRGRRF